MGGWGHNQRAIIAMEISFFERQLPDYRATPETARGLLRHEIRHDAQVHNRSRPSCSRALVASIPRLVVDNISFLQIFFTFPIFGWLGGL